MHIGDPEYDKVLVVGNMAAHRTSFVIVGVLRIKKKTQGITAGGWRRNPGESYEKGYLPKEAMIAKRVAAGGQRRLFTT